LICLDPHKTQQAVRITKDSSKEDDMSFHCQFATRSPILELDPSMAVVRINKLLSPIISSS